MKVLKEHSHKQGKEILEAERPHLLDEITTAIETLDALACLVKISRETSKIRRWGGLLFSPPAINAHFKTQLLEPQGWLHWDERRNKYTEPTLFFPDQSGETTNDRFRSIDGIKDRVGIEIQFGKYAFMGYDIFSKMIIFRNRNMIDYGIEIVAVNEMVRCMSTGVSAFEALMIDFEERKEADIDVPVLVLGIGPSPEEWERVTDLQELFRVDRAKAQAMYPDIGQYDQKGTRPGPK